MGSRARSARSAQLRASPDRGDHGGSGQDQVPGLVPRRGVQRAAEQGPQVVADPGQRQRPQHRQRVGAFDQVVAGRLAQALVVADQVADVVPDLKCHAEGVAVLRQGLHPGRGAPLTMAPIRAEVAISDAVLPAMEPR